MKDVFRGPASHNPAGSGSKGLRRSANCLDALVRLREGWRADPDQLYNDSIT